MKEFERQLNIVIVVMFLLIAAGFLGYRAGVSEKESRIVVRDTTTYVDTIPYYKPVPKDSAVVRYVTRYLPTKPKDEPNDTTPLYASVAMRLTLTASLCFPSTPSSGSAARSRLINGTLVSQVAMVTVSKANS